MDRLPVFSFKRQQKWFKNTFTSSDDGKIFGNLLLMTSETAHKGHQEGN
uniref:Uncharacterized protein n=1 Tax=Meloidogyne enterolobii TaxID=390850 RepID=A0A6V7TM87_MELEN|nr:unnamed protein product [Meloidogyne enterolobii]